MEFLRTVLYSWRTSPLNVKAMCVAVLCMPLITGFYLPSITDTFGSQGILVAALQIVMFWIVPVGLTIAALRHHPAVFPLYALAVLSIGGYLFLSSPFHGIGGVIFNLAIIATLTGGVFLLVSKDVLIPTLSGKHRKWRKNNRLPVNRLINLRFENDGIQSAVANIRNISNTGLCLVIPNSETAATKLPTAKQIELVFQILGQDFALNCEVVWKASDPDNTTVGIGSKDKAQLRSIFESLPELNRPTKVENLLDHLWSNPRVKQALTIVWVTAMATANLLPACGDSHVSRSPDGKSEAVSDQEESVENEDITFVTIPFSFVSASESHKIDDFSLDITNCKNGFQESLSAKSKRSGLALPTDNEDCMVSLAFVTIKGETYKPVKKASSFELAKNGFEEYRAKSGKTLYICIRWTGGNKVNGESRIIIEIETNSNRASNKQPEDDKTNKGKKNIPQIGLAVTRQQFVEKLDSEIQVRVYSDAKGKRPISLSLNVAGSAVEGVDYEAFDSNIDIAPGTTETIVTIALLDDGEIDGNKSIQLSVASGSGYLPLTTGALNLEILDNEYANSYPPPVNVYPENMVSYAGPSQDRTAIVSSLALTEVQLTGNGWKALPFTYNVTADTIIEFDFSSTSQGEIHGIGMEEDLALSSNRIFALYGTQTWGIRDYHSYSNYAPQQKHYKIKIGSYYSGSMNFLVFTMDDDAASRGNATFSNFVIYESGNVDPLPAHLNPPVARPDFFYIAPNAGSVDLDILANDESDAGETLYLAGIGIPDNGGSVSVVDGTRLSYEAPTDFTGVERFTYTVSDGFNHNKAEGIVTVVVNSSEAMPLYIDKLSSYAGNAQDRNGVAESANGGLGIEMLGNGWKKYPVNYVITESTVLEFDFQSDAQGEIHGIGFDNNMAISSNLTFKVYGTQSWGINTYNTYTDGSGVVTYRIPVGQFYQGEFRYLTLTNDHDAGPADGHSLFSNVRIFESVD